MQLNLFYIIIGTYSQPSVTLIFIVHIPVPLNIFAPLRNVTVPFNMRLIYFVGFLFILKSITRLCV